MDTTSTSTLTNALANTISSAQRLLDGPNSSRSLQSKQRLSHISSGFSASAGNISEAVSKRISSTLNELELTFAFLEEWCAAHQDERDHDVDQIFVRSRSSADNEFLRKLGIFYVMEEDRSGEAGEPTIKTRFTKQYQTMNADFKIRLLSITQKQDIAFDVLKHHFEELNDYSRIQLLRCSPVKREAISAELFKDFADMSKQYRLEFIRAVPLSFVERVLLEVGNRDKLSVGELLVAGNRLEGSGSSLKKEVQGICWGRRNELECPGDYLEFAVLNASIGGNLMFPLFEELCKTVERQQSIYQQKKQKNESQFGYLSSTSKSVVPLSRSSFNTFSLVLDESAFIDLVQVDHQFSLLLTSPLSEGFCGKIFLEHVGCEEDCEDVHVLGVVCNDWPCVPLYWPEELSIPEHDEESKELYRIVVSIQEDEDEEDDESQSELETGIDTSEQKMQETDHGIQRPKKKHKSSHDSRQILLVMDQGDTPPAFNYPRFLRFTLQPAETLSSLSERVLFSLGESTQSFQITFRDTNLCKLSSDSVPHFPSQSVGNVLICSIQPIESA